MKRMLLAGLFMFLAGSLWARDLWRSSWTATADTTQNLCINKRGFLHSIVVSSASPSTAGLIYVYASSGTVDSTMTLVGTTVTGDYVFDAKAISTNTAGAYDYTGLTYSKVGTAAVTILYDCQ